MPGRTARRPVLTVLRREREARGERGEGEAPCCAAAQWVADALRHVEIGVRTAGEGLPVNWDYVVYRVGRALVGQDARCEAEEAGEVERADFAEW